MSTPTSRPHDEPDRTDGDQGLTGQHAAPRATPPPPTSEQPTVPPATERSVPPSTTAASSGAPAPQVPTGPGTGAAATPVDPGYDRTRADQPHHDQPHPDHAPGDHTRTTPTDETGAHAAPAPVPAATHEQPTRRRDRGADDRPVDRDLPEPPPRPGVGRHLLGILLGLVLTPVALLLTGIGTARLADVAGTTDMGTDTLGISLLVIGLVLLAVIVLLGAWTAAVPITGGLVWGLGLGLAYLVVPGTMEDTAEAWLGQDPPPAVEQLAQSAMSGQAVLIGVLLVAAGIAASSARRAGRRWAQQVAAAEAARAEAMTAERDRIRWEADQRARGRTA